MASGSKGVESFYNVYGTTYQSSMSQFCHSELPRVQLMPTDSDSIAQNFESSYECKPEVSSTILGMQDELLPMMSELTLPDDLSMEFKEIESDDMLDSCMECAPSSSMVPSKKMVYMKHFNYLEYPDVAPDGPVNVRKRRRFFYGSVDHSKKRRQMTEVWDPDTQMVVELPYSTMLHRKKDRVDDCGQRISRSQAYNRATVAYEEDGTPLSRSTVKGRTIVAYKEDGTPISRSKASNDLIVGYEEDGTPISRSKACSRAIVAFDKDGKPLSRGNYYHRAIVDYEKDGTPISRSQASSRAIVAF